MKGHSSVQKVWWCQQHSLETCFWLVGLFNLLSIMTEVRPRTFRLTWEITQRECLSQFRVTRAQEPFCWTSLHLQWPFYPTLIYTDTHYLHLRRKVPTDTECSSKALPWGQERRTLWRGRCDFYRDSVPGKPRKPFCPTYIGSFSFPEIPSPRIEEKLKDTIRVHLQKLKTDIKLLL